MLGGKGLFDRVDVLRCVWGVKQIRDHVLATVEMIINISDFNETNFTKDEKLLCLVFSVRRTASNVKFPFFFCILVYEITERKISVALSREKMKDNFYRKMKMKLKIYLTGEPSCWYLHL